MKTIFGMLAFVLLVVGACMYSETSAKADRQALDELQTIRVERIAGADNDYKLQLWVIAHPELAAKEAAQVQAVKELR